MQIEKFQKLCSQSSIRWSVHCLERIQERDIGREDVLNCIGQGEIIEEYPDDFPHPSCLIYGYTIGNKILHVVVGCDEECVYLITAYYPTSDKFENDMKTRKRC